MGMATRVLPLLLVALVLAAGSHAFLTQNQPTQRLLNGLGHAVRAATTLAPLAPGTYGVGIALMAMHYGVNRTDADGINRMWSADPPALACAHTITSHLISPLLSRRAPGLQGLPAQGGRHVVGGAEGAGCVGWPCPSMHRSVLPVDQANQ